MKITILTIGTRGDVQPYIALGVGLKQAGYEVQIVTHSIFESFIRSYGLNFAATEGDPQGFIESEEGKKILESGSNPIEFIRLFSQSINPFIERLMSDAWQACQSTDAIIAHGLVFFWTYDFAQKLNVPYFVGSFTPFTPNTKYPVAIGSGKSLGSILNYLSYSAFSFGLWQLFRKPVNKWLQTNLGQSSSFLRLPFGYATRSPLARMRKDKVPFLYGYSNYVLPKPQNWSEQDYVTGYWFLEAIQDSKPAAELVNFLAQDNAPIYIGFGSMGNRDPKTITNIALAALEKTKQRGILATGWGGISNTDLPEIVFKIDSIDHDWLFPQCSAIVHHGGAGTTAASLKAGVPSIIVPFFSDQPFWGHRIAELGVGT
ncbi:MAG: glycosyltransferase, partial [Waterburya sp.]